MSTEAPEKEINPQAKDDITPDFLKDDAYKQRQETPAGDPSDPRGEKSLTDDQLANKEAGVGDSLKNGADSTEKDQLGRGFSGEEKPGGFSRFRKKLTANTRRKATIGIVAGALGFGGVGIFSIVQGPLQAIHLAEILSTPMSNQEDTTATRTQGFYRFFRTGNIGETRLGLVGSKMNGKIIADLEKAGIRVRTTASGQPKLIEIDPRINSELSKLSPEEARARVVKDFGVSPDKVSVSGRGLITVDAEGSKIGAKRGFLFSSLKLAYTSKARVALSSRIVTRYFQTPSIFHPMKRLEAKLDAKLAAALVNSKENKLKKKGLSDREARIKVNQAKWAKVFEPKSAARVKIDKVKKALGSKTSIATASGGLAVAGAICLANEIVGDVPAINKATASDPSATAATASLGYGSQPKSGDDFVLQQLGDYTGTLHNNEKKESVFAAAAMQALITGVSVGKDLDQDIKDAFSPNTSKSTLQKALDEVNADAICSPIGVGVQLVIGTAILATTGGAGTVIIKTITGAAVGVALIETLSYLKDRVADKPPYEYLFTGDVIDGGLRATGAEEFAGIVSRSTGGVAHSEQDSRTIRTAILDDEREEFQSKNLASRMLDVNDYRSLASRTIDSTNINSATDVNSNFAKVINPIGVLTTFSNIISGSASAAARPYDWTIPKYGFSQNILNNPDFQDPYVNASKVKDILDSNDEYIDRASECFGSEFTNGEHGWEVKPAKDVNPREDSYKDAKCADESDENWTRVRLFILDSSVMNSFACMEGDDTDPDIQRTCADLGIGSTNTETPTTPSTTPVNANLLNTVTVSEGAKFITLPSRYSCPGSTTEIDARIAASLAYILDTYEMCADDGLADGHRSHGAGLGVDIRPKDQSKQMSKDEWNRTAGRFLNDINWWGDASDEPKSSKGCARYSGYGSCVGGAAGPSGKKIPDWVRWLGYNGDVDHGDPWHIFGGSYAHIHVGWTTPNRDGISANIIRPPRQSVSTFPAPIPDDLKDILPAVLISGGSPQ